jgi:rsbT antagonist protein RsbS
MDDEFDGETNGETSEDPTDDTRVSRIPVIKLWHILLVSLQGDVTDRQAARLVADVLDQIRRGGSTGVAMDLSGLWMVDSHLCAAFTDLAAAARYMGARTVLCGLSPDIAITLQSMGIELRGIETMLTLEHALVALGLRPSGGRDKNQVRNDARRLADEMLGRNPVVDGGGASDGTGAARGGG